MSRVQSRLSGGANGRRAGERPRLFDRAARTDSAWARRVEEGFGWWGRSNKLEIIRMCDRVERWFGRYPAEDAKHLAGRFRKDLEAQHCPALFELFIHEHLRRGGYRVRCEVPVGKYLIDFQTFRHGQPALYVEAKSPSPTPAEQLSERYRGQVMDVLNRYRAPGYFVSVMLSGTPTRPVPMQEFGLESRLRKWLGGLDRQKTLALRVSNPSFEEKFDWPPFEVYAHSRPEVALEVRAVPQTQSPIIAFNSFAVTETDGRAFIPRPDLPIAAAIAEKATRYGELPLPYVIAVNSPEDSASREEVLRGIQDGLDEAGPRARSIVSGVLLAFVPNIYAAVSLSPVLYVNPHARHPLGVHAKFFRPFQDSIRAPSRRP